MGLDMHLSAERYLWTFGGDDVLLQDNIGQLLGLPTDSKVKKDIIEAGYWRKANQIHNWFVQNVQDGKDECQDADVSRDQLRELQSLCQRVLLDHSLAESLLPTVGGFFFGGTEYNSYYFDDLEDTIKIIDNALALPDQWDFTYRSSW